MKDYMKKNTLTFILVILLGFSSGYAGSYFHSQNQKESTLDKASPSLNPSTIITKESNSIKDALSVAYDSVVEITSHITKTDFFNRESTALALGSGVIISNDGYIITNNHVISGAKEVSVKDSKGNIYEAHLIGTDSKTDIAVIKIEASDLPYATLVDSDTAELGDSVIVIGNPLGKGISVSDGIVSAINKEVIIGNEVMYLLQTNAAVNEGNSGGGLFNIEGKLLGVVNAKSSSSSFGGASVEGLGYAIPSNTVSRIANDLIENGYVKNRATLGVKLYEVTSNPYGYVPGLYITEVLKDSAADKAGLEPNDRIISFEDKEILSYSELSIIMNKHEVGDEVEMKIARNDEEKEKEISVKLILQEAQNS